MKKIDEFKAKYPTYKIVRYTKPYERFYFYDEDNILHVKQNVYRAINFKIGTDSAVNKVEYIQNKLNKLNKDYLLICYKGMKSKSIVLSNGFTYEANLFDLMKGHDVSNITCIDLVKSKVSKSVKCGFSRSKFESIYRDKIVDLYLVELSNKEESFYKIGLTCRGVSQRFSAISKFGYKVKKIDTIKLKGEYAYDKEKELKKLCKENTYLPKNRYPGYTESFNKEIKKIYEHFKKNNSESC